MPQKPADGCAGQGREKLVVFHAVYLWSGIGKILREPTAIQCDINIECHRTGLIFWQVEIKHRCFQAHGDIWITGRHALAIRSKRRRRREE